MLENAPVEVPRRHRDKSADLPKGSLSNLTRFQDWSKAMGEISADSAKSNTIDEWHIQALVHDTHNSAIDRMAAQPPGSGFKLTDIDLTPFIGVSKSQPSRDNKNPEGTAAGASTATKAQHQPAKDLAAQEDSMKSTGKNLPDIELHELTMQDVKDWGNEKIKNFDSDVAAMTGFVIRTKSESLAGKVAIDGAMVSRETILGVSAIPLAGLAGYALQADIKGFEQSKSPAGSFFYASVAAIDLGALTGSAMMAYPPLQKLGTEIASPCFFARSGLGIVGKIMKLE